MLSYAQNNTIGFIYVHSLLYTLINIFNLLFYIIVLNDFISSNSDLLKTSNYNYFLSTAILTFIKYGLVVATIFYTKYISKLKYGVKLLLFIIISCINISLLIIIYSIKDKYRFILDNIEYVCYLLITGISIGYDVLLSFIILKNKEIFLNNVSYVEM